MRNRERNLAAQRRYRRKHRAAIAARGRAKRIAAGDAGREQRRLRMRAWRAANLGKARAYHRKRTGLPIPTRREPKRCELCKQEQFRGLCIDHDHNTGAFRGWLCHRCNGGLGYLGDTLRQLKRAVRYLERAQ